MSFLGQFGLASLLRFSAGGKDGVRLPVNGLRVHSFGNFDRAVEDVVFFCSLWWSSRSLGLPEDQLIMLVCCLVSQFP